MMVRPIEVFRPMAPKSGDFLTWQWKDIGPNDETVALEYAFYEAVLHAHGNFGNAIVGIEGSLDARNFAGFVPLGSNTLDRPGLMNIKGPLMMLRPVLSSAGPNTKITIVLTVVQR